MVDGRLSIRTVVPTMPGSPPNVRIQYSCVSTMTGSAAGPSSPELKTRPTIGPRPSTSK